MSKRKILLLVEGEKADIAVMCRLLTVYNLNIDYEIIPYCTNIYRLYKDFFDSGDDPENLDLLLLLKSRDKNPDHAYIFNEHYSDIYLVFDFDPQDTGFSPDKIRKMIDFFHESSDMGKLYLNYPMVESFYHLKSLPDANYDERFASMDELRRKAYKQRVQNEKYAKNYQLCASNRKTCNIVIHQNIEKALYLTHSLNNNSPFNQSAILESELNWIASESKVPVLCTCCFFIPEYQPALIESDD